MQNLLLITLTTLLTFGFVQSGNAQKLKTSEVPVTVRVAFEKESPDARKIDWYQNEDKYIVEYHQNGKDGKALFTADGSLLVLELEVTPDDIPIKALAYLSLKYSKRSEILKALLKKTAGFTMYELEVAIAEEQKKLLFDEYGGFLMEVKGSDG